MPGYSARPQFPHLPPYVIPKGTFRSKSNQGTTRQPGLLAVSAGSSVRPLLGRPGAHGGAEGGVGGKGPRGRAGPCGSNPREAGGGERPRRGRTPPAAHLNPCFLPGGGGSGGKGSDSSRPARPSAPPPGSPRPLGPSRPVPQPAPPRAPGRPAPPARPRPSSLARPAACADRPGRVVRASGPSLTYCVSQYGSSRRHPATGVPASGSDGPTRARNAVCGSVCVAGSSRTSGPERALQGSTGPHC